jgi:CBS domain containing-hemolysin-like protein
LSPVLAALLAVGLLLILVALIAAAQAALYHANRARLRHSLESSVHRRSAVLRALEQPVNSLSALTVLWTMALLALAAVSNYLLLQLETVDLLTPLLIASGLVLTTLMLQVLARVLGIARPEATALVVYRPLALLGAALAPIVLPFRALEHRLLAFLGVNRPNDPQSAEDEILMLVEAGEEAGGLEQEEREMIHGIFELSEVTAREVMVPRIDIVALPSHALAEQALDQVVASGHSRLPVYDGSIDNIVGVMYAKDLLQHLKTGSLEDPVLSLARPAYFVPEAKKLDEVLQELQQRRVHIAIVVDEYGGTAGLLTIEDLLEEIVGEIRDEYDLAEEARIERVSDNEAILDARIGIREVNDLLSLHLPDDEFDTISGLVYDRLGKVPEGDDEVRVDGCTIRVISTEGRRIKKVRLVVGSED